MIISSFPGVGKSELCRLYQGCRSFEENPQECDLDTYVEKVKQCSEVALVSSRMHVRRKLKEAGLNFCIVLPSIRLKEEYIERYRQRGEPSQFIDFMNRHWEEWISELMTQPGKIMLSSGQSLKDIAHMIPGLRR